MKIWQLFVLGSMLVMSAPAMAQKKASTASVKTANNVCIVSGEKIENVAKAPKFTYKGKSYAFCCNGCMNKFKANPTTYLTKTASVKSASKTAGASCCADGKCDDEKTADAKGACCAEEGNTAATKTASKQPTAAELKQYANVVNGKLWCPVMDEFVEDMKKGIKVAHAGKTYLLCCSDCRKSFNKNPAKYAKMVTDKQKTN